MTLQELIDWLTKVPECTGTVSVGRDEMYGVSKCPEGFHPIEQCATHQEHGYVARTLIGGAS